MPDLTVDVYMEPIDSEPRTGIWCDRCNLPSGVSMSFTMQIGDGPLSMCTVSRCIDCCEPTTG